MVSVPVVHCRTLVVVNITTLAVMAAPGPTVEVHKHLDYHYSDVFLASLIAIIMSVVRVETN